VGVLAVFWRYFDGILTGPEIMFAVVVFRGFENQNGGGGTGTVFHF